MDTARPLTTSDADTRRAAIMAAAFEVFASYGFRRTSMEDIARKAGVSRALLYQHFSNKEDIIRSLVQRYFDGVIAQVRITLETPAPLPDVLRGAFRAKMGPVMEVILQSPHGAELLDPANANCTDLVRSGEESLASLFTDWLARAETEGLVDLASFGTAADTARTMLAAAAGLKSPGTTPAQFYAASDRLASLFARGLAP